METVKQLAGNLLALQSGNCWIGYNASEILEGITSEMAQTNAFEKGNTIWQIVNHISFWRDITASRLTEKKGIDTDETGMDQPAMLSDDAWAQTKQRFNDSFQSLHTAILNIREEELSLKLGEQGTVYSNITGCLQHDAFHLGQIMLLKRLASAQ
jgi:hypothetical protein